MPRIADPPASLITRTEGDTFFVEIPIGTAAEDRKFAAVQFVVMLFGLMIVLPDFRLFRFGMDAGLVIRSVFAGFWVAIGLVGPLRLFFPPKPITLRFSPKRFIFDSGRAGLKYLGTAFENDLARLFSIAFQFRKRWTLQHSEIRVASPRVLVSESRIRIQSQNQVYDLGNGIPDALRFTLRDAILRWIEANSARAPAEASKAFSRRQVLKPTLTDP